MTGSTYETKAGTYKIKALLGKGKSGYSYLAEKEGEQRVLKLMHDEPCAYYTFEDNKTRLEVGAYERLRALQINVPILYEYDPERNYLVKEYTPGRRAAEAIAEGTVGEAVFKQLFAMSNKLVPHGLNIDYFPTNFIVGNKGVLYYIDYEINPYAEEWNLPNWGIYYWVNEQGMRDFLRTGDGSFINQDSNSGIPIKAELEEQVKRLIDKFASQ